MSHNWLQLERVTGSSHWHHAKADPYDEPSTPAMIIDAWVDRQRESHSRPTTQEEELAQRRALCAADSGLVLGSWSGWVGTCNSLVRILTGALVAAVLDRPFVIFTDVFDREQDRSRVEPRTRVFDASLAEALSGIGGMAWLQPPVGVFEERTFRIDGWARSAREVTTNQLRHEVVRWCGEVGVNLSLTSDIAAVDLRSPAGQVSPHGSFDAQRMMARPKDSGVCGDVSSARIVGVHVDPVPNIEILALNRALPPAAAHRLEALTRRGVNSYGLMQRAIFPAGLTRVTTVERPTVAVHLRCWMNACINRTLTQAARCLRRLVEQEERDEAAVQYTNDEDNREEPAASLTAGVGGSARSSCSIYVASDHAGMAAVLRQYLDPHVLARCTLQTAAEVRLPTALRREVRVFMANSSFAAGRWAHAATRHDLGTASAHPAPWADPIDLALLSHAQTVLAVSSGVLSSTVAYIAGTRAGRFFFIDSERSGGCVPASELFPASPDASARAYVYGEARHRTLTCSTRGGG
jgi:hypothetical protein